MKPNLSPKDLATALFNVSEQNNILEQVKSAIVFLNDIVANNGQFRMFIQSKKIEGGQKTEILNSILGESGHPLVNEMVSYLHGSKAPKDLKDISNFFDLMYRKGNNVLQVKGIVAQEISESQIQSLKASLDALLGKQTELSLEVDPTLIGGIKLRIENTFLDASIQNQLQTLRTELLQI